MKAFSLSVGDLMYSVDPEMSMAGLEVAKGDCKSITVSATDRSSSSARGISS